MKKGILYFILRLLLITGYITFGCLNANAQKQRSYTYQAESFGYNDIKKLYSTDTINSKKSFFESSTLQYLEGTLNTSIIRTTLRKSCSGVLICYQLIKPSLNLKRESISLSLDAVINDLTKPVFVKIDNNGTILRIHFNEEISQIAIGFFKDIISRMQFVKPETGKLDQWSTKEENAMGIYTAIYTKLDSNAEKNFYDKKIIRYDSLSGHRKGQKIETDTQTTIVTNTNDILQDVKIAEAQTVVKNLDTISVIGLKLSIIKSAETVLKSKQAKALLAILASDAYQESTSLSKTLSALEIKQMSYKGSLGTDTWATTLQKLSHYQQLTRQGKEELVFKFKALFNLHPESCKKAVILINDKSQKTFVQKVLITALSITETSAAVNALVFLIEENKNNEDMLAKLLPVLTTTKTPTKNAINVVKSLAFSSDKTQDYFITSTAQLALGGMANSLRLSDTLKSDTLTDFIMDKMKYEKDTVQRLLVLGNTGSPKILPYIKSLMNDEKVSSSIKVEAVSALALVNKKEVSSYLKKLLVHKNNEVQDKAKEVRDFRKKGPDL